MWEVWLKKGLGRIRLTSTYIGRTAVAWNLDDAIERIVDDFEDGTVADAEVERRHLLELAVFDRLGVDPTAVIDDVSSRSMKLLAHKAA